MHKYLAINYTQCVRKSCAV